jgi:hypothetical protein
MDAQRGATALERPPGHPDPAPFPDAPVRPRSRKAAPRPVPQRDEAYAHLSLDGLRAYRKALAEEEHRVSYWRRILQARLDLLRAGMEGTSGRPVDTAALSPVLTDARVGAGRRVLVDAVPHDDMPPLPQLEQLWQRHADPEDVEATADLECSLAQAERQLSDYRNALHRRIAEATGELIARYRETPSLCLTALPLRG